MDLLQWFIIYLIEKLHKPIIRKFEEKKLSFIDKKSFIDNICGADLADMQSISKFNKRFICYYALLTFIINMHGLFL